MAEQESVYLWSNTAASNATADPAINFSEGQLPSTLNNSNRAAMAAIAHDKKDTNGSLTTAGSANAYTLTINGRQTPLATGHRLTFKASFSNTGAATLAVTNADAVALGAKAIRGPGDVALASGQMVSGGVYDVRYDTAANAAAGAWILLNPTALAGWDPPRGRLTLTNVTPVLNATVSAATTVYYTPYLGNLIPLYDGTNMVPTVFTELSQATTDTTKSPAAVAANSVYDIFVWDDSGTIRATRGPAWTNDTTRSAGTVLVRTNGLLLNNASITNGPAASRGTYVGTIRSNGSSQIDFIFGASAAGGTAAFLGVWNAYNRVNVNTTVTDSTATWTYTSTTVRAANASNGNRVTFVSGLAEDGIKATYFDGIATAAAVNAFGNIGIALDATNVFDKRAFALDPVATAANFTIAAPNSYAPQLGVHFIQATESGDGTNITTYDGGVFQGLSVELRM